MGSAFRFGLIVFALSAMMGVITFMMWPGGDIQVPNIFTGEIVSRSPYLPFILYPLILGFALALAYAVMRAKPDMRDTQFRNVVLAGTAVLCFINQIAEAAYLFGAPSSGLNFMQFAGFQAGIFLILAGNYLPKAARGDSLDLPRPWNYFFSIPWTLPFGYLFGVRTWWTLASEHVWNRTHRLAGRLWIISGIMLAVAPWMTDLAGYINVIMASLVLNIVAPVVYSFVLRQAETTA